MNAHHAPAYHTDACAKCGVSAKQIADGASPWCDYLDRAPHGRWPMLAHTIAILLLVIAPIYGLTGSIGLSLLAFAVGVTVASIHSGAWDFVGEMIGESDRGMRDRYEDDPVADRMLNAERN